MNEPLLHPETSQQVKTLLGQPPHSLLIIGAPGSGKAYLANYIASKIIGVEPDRLENQPHYIRLEKPKDKQEIPIDDVRRIIRQLALKTSGHRRIVLIDQSQLLSEEAQSALLKSIEEPPEMTHFILTSPAVSLLLPTIVSRSQKIAVKPVSLEATLGYFGDYSQAQVTAAWNLSRSAPGLMAALLQNDDEHPLKKAVDQAKEFIRMDKYQRTLFLDKLSSSKSDYLVFLDALDRLLAALAVSSIKSQKTGQASRIMRARRLIDSSIAGLSVNASPRLVSLHLAQRLTL